MSVTNQAHPHSYKSSDITRPQKHDEHGIGIHLEKRPGVSNGDTILQEQQEGGDGSSGRHSKYALCISALRSKQETQLSLTNLRNAFIGQSRSPNIVPFHMLDKLIVSYCAIVTLSLRRAVFTTFDFKNVVSL